MSKNGGIWIDKEFKNVYSDSEKQGLRLFFDSRISLDDKLKIKQYVKWLRKRYFFPIQCKVFFAYRKSFTSVDRIHKCKGLFLFGQEDEQKLPSIYVPTQLSENLLFEDVIYYLTHLLTYYQWYFFDDKNRSHRSLEIEATKYADYLTYTYLEEIGKSI